MTAFQYQALDSGGQTQRGVLEADTARSARAILRDRGLNPLEVEVVREGRTRSTIWFDRDRLRAAELAVLAREIATLVGSGLPIDESLGALADQADTPRSKAMVSSLRSRVMEGQSLAQAMGNFPASFNDLFRATVAAGEQSGRLGAALEALADYTERREALQRKTWMALAYPALVTLIALLIVTGLLTYVVPQITGVFTNLNRELPIITRILIGISDAFKSYGLWFFIALIAIVFGIRSTLQQTTTRLKFDRWILTAPLFGRLLRAGNTASGMRTLGMLISTGVPVLEALKIATMALPNRAMQDAMRTVTAKVREGGGFARALADSKQFPQVALKLIASGEKTGRLGEMLGQAALHQERELDARLNTLMAILGPAMILLVGAMVLFIVLAILLPIFQLNSLIR